MAVMMAQATLLFLLFLLKFSSGDLGYQWTKIHGSMSEVYANVEFIWGINPHKNLYYCARPCTGNWIHSASNVKGFDTEFIYAWLSSTNSYVYLKVSDSAGSWGKRTDYPRNVIDFAASGNLYVWVLTSTRELYRWRHINFAVVKFPGKFDQIDVNVDYLFALDATSHAINYRKVDGKGEWRVIPGKMKYVTAGSHDIFAIGVDDKLYRCTIPCAGGIWELMGSPERGVVQLDATIDALFAVTSGGNIYRHEIPL